MNPQQDEIRRAEETFTSIIRSNRSKTESLKQFRKEYDELSEVIKGLPKKLTHQIMVPVGKMAFMSGYIEHANELTVLLGENTFLQCTAAHALGIVERRQEFIDKQLGELQREYKLIQDRVGLTNEMLEPQPVRNFSIHISSDTSAKPVPGGFVEINETEDEALELATSAKPKAKPKIEVLSSHSLDDDEEYEKVDADELEEEDQFLADLKASARANEGVEATAEAEELVEPNASDRDKAKQLLASDDSQWDGLSTDAMLAKAIELEEAIETGKVSLEEVSALVAKNKAAQKKVTESSAQPTTKKPTGAATATAGPAKAAPKSTPGPVPVVEKPAPRPGLAPLQIVERDSTIAGSVPPSQASGPAQAAPKKVSKFKQSLGQD